ncbi:Uncharacterized protein HZ326_25141 [Fusarium oxysporum f. sp. albedinis]|nr:Uncharacterized protein HZ326_25141 [Fusarium oxysporum f. sp. albedinis]
MEYMPSNPVTTGITFQLYTSQIPHDFRMLFLDPFKPLLNPKFKPLTPESATARPDITTAAIIGTHSCVPQST